MSTVIPAYAGDLPTLVNELVSTRSTIGVRLYTLDHGTTIDSRTHLRHPGERRDLVVTDRYEPACARILRTPCSASAEYSSSTSSAR